jgi:hypothetical protein
MLNNALKIRGSNMESTLISIQSTIKKFFSRKIIFPFIYIWFAASVLSQALYIGFHGVPYDSTLMIALLGPWYLLVVIIEALVWAVLGIILLSKMFSTRQQKPIPQVP